MPQVVTRILTENGKSEKRGGYFSYLSVDLYLEDFCLELLTICFMELCQKYIFTVDLDACSELVNSHTSIAASSSSTP